MASNLIRIVPAVASAHRSGILTLLAGHLLAREPIQNALKVGWTEACQTYTPLVDDVLTQSNSFVAMDPRTNQVIGCRLSKLMDINRNAPEPDLFPIYGPAPNMRILKMVVDRLMKGWREDFIECRKLFLFVAVCVHPEYARTGVAKSMMTESISLAGRVGADHIMAVATNIKSQKILEQRGFYTRKLLNYDDVVDEHDRKILQMSDGTKSINWMVKKVDCSGSRL